MAVMKVQIRYFASLREALGMPGETLETTSEDVAALRAELMAKGDAYAQALSSVRAVRVAVNQVMASGDTRLSDQCEVGFFPPVTGG
jgi:molybdopterin synthase sulfur carrier subunit